MPHSSRRRLEPERERAQRPQRMIINKEDETEQNNNPYKDIIPYNRINGAKIQRAVPAGFYGSKVYDCRRT
jgi:hypothetical protein